MKITSVNNDLVKETAKLLKSKYRNETGLFLIEGKKGYEEAVSAGLKIKYVFVKESETELVGENIIETTEAVLSKISEAKTPPQIVAVAEQPNYNLDILKTVKKVLLLEGIKDAGNLGTILRSASAFEFDAVILYGETVDLYNPKCVRSTVGNLWKIPVIKIKDFALLKEYFINFERVATLPKHTNSIWLNDYVPPEFLMVMFGSEAEGLSEELKSFATKNITIEMSPVVESLNLSISAGVFMYYVYSNK